MIRSASYSHPLSSRRRNTVVKVANGKVSMSAHHKNSRTHKKQKFYTWTNTPYYIQASTHRTFTEKERDTLDNAVNTYRKTLDFPYGVEELIDWKSIQIPGRSTQECRDEWYTSFGPDSQYNAVCLTRDKRFWRIQYYSNIIDSQRKNAGHPAFVYYGVIGSTHPHSYLIPHTSAIEVQELIRKKKNRGYHNDGIHTGVVYLQYEDLRNMSVGTEFTVGINSDTGTPGDDYGIQRVRVEEHFEHHTVLHDVNKPSRILYQLFQGSLVQPPPGGWTTVQHATNALLHSTRAVYTNAEYPLIVHPNPLDPVYGIFWQSSSSKPPPSLMKRLMNNTSHISRKKMSTIALYGVLGAAMGKVMARPLLEQLRKSLYTQVRK